MEPVDDVMERYRSMRWLPAVEVKYLGPTNSRGSRIRFRRLDTGTVVVVPFEHRYDFLRYTAAVAEQMLGVPVVGVHAPDRILFVPERS